VDPWIRAVPTIAGQIALLRQPSVVPNVDQGSGRGVRPENPIRGTQRNMKRLASTVLKEICREIKALHWNLWRLISPMPDAGALGSESRCYYSQALGWQAPRRRLPGQSAAALAPFRMRCGDG